MSAMPAWTSGGLIPPINPISPTSADRSPYVISVTDFALRFSTSLERCMILKGFLEYRIALHAVGISDGFQWIDGSFLEHIELIASRAPDDIDVVTFFNVLPGDSQGSIIVRNAALFPGTEAAKAALKATYRVDAAYIDLKIHSPEQLVSWSAYWYGVWSHRRDYSWKGFAQIPLNSTDDIAALQTLLQCSHMTGTA